MRVVAILAIIMAVVGVGLAWPVLTREAIRRRNREAMIRIGRSYAGRGALYDHRGIPRQVGQMLNMGTTIGEIMERDQ